MCFFPLCCSSSLSFFRSFIQSDSASIIYLRLRYIFFVCAHAVCLTVILVYRFLCMIIILNFKVFFSYFFAFPFQMYACWAVIVSLSGDTYRLHRDHKISIVFFLFHSFSTFYFLLIVSQSFENWFRIGGKMLSILMDFNAFYFTFYSNKSLTDLWKHCFSMDNDNSFIEDVFHESNKFKNFKNE